MCSYACVSELVCACCVPNCFVCAEVKVEVENRRADAKAIHQRRTDNARGDYERCLRVGAGVEGGSSPDGQRQWEGMLAHAAIYGVPLTRQAAFTHWLTGVQPRGA